MTWGLSANGHFNDVEEFRHLEVRLDELAREFAEKLQEEFGDSLTSFQVWGNYIGTQIIVPPSGEARPTLPDSDPGPASSSDFIDESVVDEDSDDDGLGDDSVLPGDVGAPDAGGPHPGDVLDPANADLAVNRPNPTTELAPNPEDMLGRGEGYERTEEE